GCCGALVHHLGDELPALAFARANIDAWERERTVGGLDAIVANASGCGTMLKDYSFLFREDRAYAEKATRIAELARDVTEVLAELGLRDPLTLPSPPVGERVAQGWRGGAETYPELSEGDSVVGAVPKLRVAYHSACSLQHGQRVNREPRALIAAAGFEVVEI